MVRHTIGSLCQNLENESATGQLFWCSTVPTAQGTQLVILSFFGNFHLQDKEIVQAVKQDNPDRSTLEEKLPSDEEDREMEEVAIKEGVPDPSTLEEKFPSDEEDLTEEQSINNNMPVEHQASVFQRFVLWIVQRFRRFFDG